VLLKTCSKCYLCFVTDSYLRKLALLRVLAPVPGSRATALSALIWETGLKGLLREEQAGAFPTYQLGEEEQAARLFLPH